MIGFYRLLAHGIGDALSFEIHHLAIAGDEHNGAGNLPDLDLHLQCIVDERELGAGEAHVLRFSQGCLRQSGQRQSHQNRDTHNANSQTLHFSGLPNNWHGLHAGAA